VQTDGIVHLGNLQLDGGTLLLVARGTPGAVALDQTDPEFTGKSVNGLPTTQASATIVQDPGGTLASAVGSLLALRAPSGGSILLEQPGNALLGSISAVSGSLGETDQARFTAASGVMLRFVRIESSQINVAGRPNGDPALLPAGIEGDVVKVTADTLSTGADGLIRARLPFSNLVGSNASIPGITFVLSNVTLSGAAHFGTPTAPVQVQVGAADGGFITARPHVGGDNAVIFLGGGVDVRPFYDGTGKLAEIRVFYNGDAPRTPQEAGALAAVIALIEDARHARFEEAVRTENVSSRLRSGVIAEVGAGRPATVGRESIRLPENCPVKPGGLQCGDR
jgi:hypothetical protein